MRFQRAVKKFTPYVVQIGNLKEVLYVNYASDVTQAFKDFLHKHSHLRHSVLRPDLYDETAYFTSSRRADRAGRLLVDRLEEQGYEVIAGAPVLKEYWRVYVIEVDGDPKFLYVGETNYPVEKRFQQHVCKFNPARIFLKYDQLELAMQHAEHLPPYKSKQESLAAEVALADELRKKG